MTFRGTKGVGIFSLFWGGKALGQRSSGKFLRRNTVPNRCEDRGGWIYISNSTDSLHLFLLRGGEGNNVSTIKSPGIRVGFVMSG